MIFESRSDKRLADLLEDIGFSVRSFTQIDFSSRHRRVECKATKEENNGRSTLFLRVDGEQKANSFETIVQVNVEARDEEESARLTDMVAMTVGNEFRFSAATV